MTKTFAALLFLGVASIGQAAFIQCQPPQSRVIADGVANAVAFSCDPGGDNVAADGLVVTDIQIRVSGTFQENNGPEGQVFSVLFSGTNNSGSFTLGPVSCTASNPADANNQALGACVETSAFASVANLDFVPGFTVNVSGGPGSAVLPFNASASVFYQVNTARPSDIPEPATYTMLGLGLVGAYLARRKS